tara:strand:+ start:5187 stop:5801 length:615 start_codon:yes stop_codon:yes gene_type:complete
MLNKPNGLEAGVDEVGRGPLAGPVVAAAVILPEEFDEDEPLVKQIKDSKKLSSKKRAQVAEYIKEIAIDFHVAFIHNEEIDRLNIRNATSKAMHEAIDGLNVEPDKLLIDGDFYYPRRTSDGTKENYLTVEGGDNKYMSIAAASILAKEERDNFVINTMVPSLDGKDYSWDTNKCYGTKQHYDAIRTHGITKWHRLSFNLEKGW